MHGFGPSAHELRSYFFFDVSDVVAVITEARLEVRRYDTTSGSTLGLFDVSTPAAALIATRGAESNPAIFADLGSGVEYGSFVIGPGESTDILSIALDASAIADLNAATGYFAIGGRALAGGPIFASSNFEPDSVQQLVLTVQDVPEPGTLTFVVAGLCLISRSRHRKAS